MSLILDALRKADAEREQGSVPSLHSQPVVDPSPHATATPRARPNWLWVAIGVAAGLVASAIWVMVARETPVPNSATTNPATSAVTPMASAPESSAMSVPPPAPAPATGQPVAEPAPWPQPEQRRTPNADAQRDTSVQVASATPPVYSREQLPADVRSALPQITIGGSIYSASPAARSLIVNGRLYREGDRVAPELSLEEIKLKSAIFGIRGYRFEVLY